MEDLNLEKTRTSCKVRLSGLTDANIGVRLLVKVGVASESVSLTSEEVTETRDWLTQWLTQWLKENPVKLERWANAYLDNIIVHPTREKADESAGPNRIACVPISYHIGQGLEEENE